MTTTVTPIPDRLAALDTLTLDGGSHDNFDDGHCGMEVVAWLAGEDFTDAPACVSRVLRALTISLNDAWDDDTRQHLKPFLVRMIGTGGDGQDETRSYMALDWLVRTYAPVWLDLAGLTAEATALRDLRRIVDMASAEAAGPVVRDSRDRAAAWATARVAGGVAARATAWDAAGDAAWDAAWDAARDAGWVAGGIAARDAAWDAARDAGGVAAWAAAWAAASAAAGDAARDALRPTVATLQASALDLLDRMIDPKASVR